MPTRQPAPAPSRGHYDRALTRRERQDAQRERVTGALAHLSATGRDLNVANVVEVAAIGRNTFYEYFDDVEHALHALSVRARRELSARVAFEQTSARTPHERIRALAWGWVHTALAQPNWVRLALRPPTRARHHAQLSALGEHLRDLLSTEVSARSALPGLADPLKVEAVAAVFETISRAHFGPRPMSKQSLHAALVDVSLRLLR